MAFVMSGNEILEKYRRALTPRERREQIQILADLNGCDKRDIAEFLRACGETVDGRIGSTQTKKPEIAPTEDLPAVPEAPEEPEAVAEEEPAAEPQQEEPECCENAAEPEGPRMTAGVLVELLSKVKPEALIRLDGEGYAGGLLVSVMYDATGEWEEMEATILPQGW